MISIDQARQRYLSSAAAHPSKSSARFSAQFFALDCYTDSLSTVIAPENLPPQAPPFDVVSMQFCMHYAFESVQKARVMLENVTRWLRPGGVFVGTIPNDRLLLCVERMSLLHLPSLNLLLLGLGTVLTRYHRHRTLRTSLSATPSTKFASTTTSGDPSSVTGTGSSLRTRWKMCPSTSSAGRTSFSAYFLTTSRSCIRQYSRPWLTLCCSRRMASEYRLHPLYKAEFHDVYAEHSEHPEFGPLLERMKVVDKSGASQMDEDQWEAASACRSKYYPGI